MARNKRNKKNQGRKRRNLEQLLATELCHKVPRSLEELLEHYRSMLDEFLKQVCELHYEIKELCVEDSLLGQFVLALLHDEAARDATDCTRATARELAAALGLPSTSVNDVADEDAKLYHENWDETCHDFRIIIRKWLMPTHYPCSVRELLFGFRMPAEGRVEEGECVEEDEGTNDLADRAVATLLLDCLDEQSREFFSAMRRIREITDMVPFAKVLLSWLRQASPPVSVTLRVPAGEAAEQVRRVLWQRIVVSRLERPSRILRLFAVKKQLALQVFSIFTEQPGCVDIAPSYVKLEQARCDGAALTRIKRTQHINLLVDTDVVHVQNQASLLEALRKNCNTFGLRSVTSFNCKESALKNVDWGMRNKNLINAVRRASVQAEVLVTTRLPDEVIKALQHMYRLPLQRGFPLVFPKKVPTVICITRSNCTGLDFFNAIDCALDLRTPLAEVGDYCFECGSPCKSVSLHEFFRDEPRAYFNERQRRRFLEERGPILAQISENREANEQGRAECLRRCTNTLCGVDAFTQTIQEARRSRPRIWRRD
ncbi:MAG: hypothetical protein MHM6MM_004924 [Cercozoa sp. M6MM]